MVLSVEQAEQLAENVAEDVFTLPEPSWLEQYGRWFWGSIGILSCILGWQVLASTGIFDIRFTSSPLQVAIAGAKLMQTGQFWVNVSSTGKTLAIGLLIAMITGMVIGLLAGWFRTLNALLDPIIAALYAVPFVVFLPMIIIWFGLGDMSRIVIIIWAAIFPLVINTMQGVQDINKDYLKVGRSFCATQMQMFLGIVVPGSLPYILAGLRLAIGRSLVGAITAEFFIASKGLGFFINVSSNNLNMAAAFFGIIILSIIGVGLVAAVRYVEKKFSGWT